MSRSPAPDFARFVLQFPQPRTDADNARLATEYAVMMNVDEPEALRVVELGGEQPAEFLPTPGDPIWTIIWNPATATYEWKEIAYQPDAEPERDLPDWHWLEQGLHDRN